MEEEKQAEVVQPTLGSEGGVGGGRSSLTRKEAPFLLNLCLKGKLISRLIFWISLDEVHEKMAKFSRAP